MNNQRSEEIAKRLLAAVSAEDVNKVLKSEPLFASDGNWWPYGNSPKNWDRVGVQTSEPVGAFAELIINSIDAILMRKASEHGVDGHAQDAPRSMFEAVQRWFQVVEGQITQLDARHQTELAEKAVIVGIKRASNRRKYPTYTIADFGEGQNADDFPKTLLSLGEKNKEGIPFVQGRFNMGSTGSITFCTRAQILGGLYKFILSKRALGDSDGNWGWTIIRTRKAKHDEDLPVVEYFCPGNSIPRFAGGDIESLGHSEIGVIDRGTIVKLYEYDIGPSARGVDPGLANALTLNLLQCALPVRIYDFDAERDESRDKLRKQGIAARTFVGLRLGPEDRDVPDFTDNQILEDTSNPEIGKIRIIASGRRSLTDHVRNYPFRFFYTVNGQAQAKERASFFNKIKRGDLYNHLIVQVDCNEMDKTARADIFKPDRERMSGGELSRRLKDMVGDAIRNDGMLRDYARRLRELRTNEQFEDDSETAKFWASFIKNSPEFHELFGTGADIDQPKQEAKPGPQEHIGKKFPTFLKLLRPDPSSKVLELPVNTYRRIECLTDASDNYLGRQHDKGEFIWHTAKEALPYSVALRNGKMRITVWPPENPIVGHVIPVQFGIDDSSRVNPIQHQIEVKLVAKEKVQSHPRGKSSGVGRKTEPELKIPDIQWVEEQNWNDYGFNAASGAKCQEEPEGVVVYVNRGNERLKALLREEPNEDSQKHLQNVFRYGVGLLTLAVYQKVKERDYHQQASSAIAAHIVTLIRKLGGVLR